MSLYMSGSWWRVVREKANVLFPIGAVLAAAVILSSPFYSGPFSWLWQNAFARFCMFWCLAVFFVLSLSNRRARPAATSLTSVLASGVVGALFTVVCVQVVGPLDMSSLLLPCLSGAILGALAGTWLLYVLEVYAGGR